MSSSSQSRVVVLIHLQICFLLLRLLVYFGRCTVQDIVIILPFELVTFLVASEATTSTTTRSSTTAATVSTATTSASSTTGWLLILNLSGFVILRFFLSVLLHFIDLLLQLSATIFLEPCLFLNDKTNTVIEIFCYVRSSDTKKGKFLDDDQVQVECLLVLDNFLLFLALLLSGSTDR